MGLIQQFLKSFRETEEVEPGIIQKADGTVWLVNPDGTETQLPGGGGGGQPDLLSRCREMTGEFGTFTVDVKDEVVDRVSEGTSALTGR